MGCLARASRGPATPAHSTQKTTVYYCGRSAIGVLSFARMPSSILRPGPCLSLLAALTSLLGACKRASPPEAAAPADAPAASAPGPDAGRAPAPPDQPLVVKFSDAGNAGIFAYAKREGILEKELAKVNATIAWIPAAGAFSANFDAMNSGAMNASGGAISPIIGALSHNLQFKIYGIADPGGTTRAGIISPASSAIRSVKDLVGKRVAVNLAAHGDYILLKALADAGIPASKVERVPIQPPDAAAAFAAGRIDAWSTFGIFFSTAIKNGAHVVKLERDLHSDDVGVLAANVAALEKNPAAFQVILRVSQELTALARAHPEKFQNVFRDKGPTAVSGDELRLATEDTRTLPAFRVPTAADRARVNNVARIFFANRSIDRDISVNDIVFDIDQAAKLRAAIASPERPAAEAARDGWRHPAQTLTFFGLRDDENVVELWPGGGWFTAILAPLLAENGSLAVTSFEPDGPPDAEATHFAKKYADRLASKPDVFGKVQTRIIASPTAISLGPDGSADLVVTFRNFHNWVKDGIAGNVLAAAFRVLKPGGVFGVEEHRAAPDGATDAAKTIERIDETGYVPEAYVIELARQAGFALEARSEINANPLDSKDWPKGVWTLPPTLRLGAQDRARYQAIGESDRMTLRFRKP
jgi:predicted methyltransferase/ABC-type nitrate/sulfonate/bicarbonate transport system substrate-binding protein